MNLQRYLSTVYSEGIKTKDKSDKETEDMKELNGLLQNFTKNSFQDFRSEYLINLGKPGKSETTETKKGSTDFLVRDMFFEKMFGNNIRRLYKDRSNTIFLFPVYQEKPSDSRLKPEIKEIYSDLIYEKTTKEFDKKENGNLYMFIPAFSEDDETKEEFTDRMTSYFERAFEYILDQKPKRLGDVYENKEKFESIIYTVNKEGEIFTDYYKKKISSAKVKILNEKVERFVQKLGCRLFTVTDPIQKLTKEDTAKKYKEQFGTLKDKDKTLLNNFDLLLESFLDIYKKSTDEAYRSMVSSRENQSSYRLFYRIHNTDIEDSYDVIKTGSTYVYALSMPGQTTLYGYFNERKGTTDQYTFREYAGITSQEAKNDFDELEDTEDHKELIVEIKKKNGTIRYKKVTQDDFSEKYPGTIEFDRNLHIYEKYKWFHFNELDGTLPAETKIKYYKNLRFDKESFVAFLNFKKEYNEKTRVAVEFLKVNLDAARMSEYSSYLTTYKKRTHVYFDSMFGEKLPSFIEKTKKSIADLLFRSNELLYFTGQSSSGSKKNLKKNYKIVGHQYFKVDDESTAMETRLKHSQSFFDRTLFDGVELGYCKQRKCELFDEIKKKPKNTEFGVLIVDVTKDNVEVVSELKEKAKCKRLRKTLRRQLKPFMDLIPRFGGSRTRKRRTSA